MRMNSTDHSPPPRERIEREARVPETLAGKRFDQIAAQLFSEFSRGQLQNWIEGGALTVDGATARPRQKLFAGATLRLNADFAPSADWIAQPGALDIVYEDEQLLVLNKPADTVVHPAAGIADNTLVNFVLHHAPANAELPRGGIVHRLDRDTTGLMVVAKTLAAHHHLVDQLQRRSVSRNYLAIASGQLLSGRSIDAPIGRHPTQRTKMAVVDASIHSGARVAITHVRIAQRFGHYTELRVALETGRTHQIRVHLAHIGHAIVGDPVYNPRYRRPPTIDDALDQTLRSFGRQALHATQLELLHPSTGEPCRWQAEPPADYLALRAALEQHDALTAG